MKVETRSFKNRETRRLGDFSFLRHEQIEMQRHLFVHAWCAHAAAHARLHRRAHQQRWKRDRSSGRGPRAVSGTGGRRLPRCLAHLPGALEEIALEQTLVVQPTLREPQVPRSLAHLPEALGEMKLDQPVPSACPAGSVPSRSGRAL